MPHSQPDAPRPRLLRHLPDACLALALLVVLALSLKEEGSGRTDWLDAAREAVSGQLGVPVEGPSVAAGSRAPAAAPAAPG